MMTDKEKQSCGQLYNPTAGDICTMRKRGTDLARQFNSCEDPDEQKKILQTLFSETGENVGVNPPFYIDFGCHTHIGNDTVINLNCTFLDAADIFIGSRVLIGPDVKIYLLLGKEDRMEEKTSREEIFQILGGLDDTKLIKLAGAAKILYDIA